MATLSQVRIIVSMIACLFLHRCYFLPANFDSGLDISRNGEFTLRYKGEFKFLVVDQHLRAPATTAWRDGDAQCFEEKTYTRHPCGSDEVAEQKDCIKQRKSGKYKSEKS